MQWLKSLRLMHQRRLMRKCQLNPNKKTRRTRNRPTRINLKPKKREMKRSQTNQKTRRRMGARKVAQQKKYKHNSDASVTNNFHFRYVTIRGLGFGVWGLGFGVWEIGRASCR